VAFASVAEKASQLDILVNAAGTIQRTDPLEVTLAEWE
jgi:NADP-dependent 3-hydroxy acid dehydrogenase YdfG